MNSTRDKGAFCNLALQLGRVRTAAAVTDVCWHKPIPGVEMLAGQFGTVADRAM